MLAVRNGILDINIIMPGSSAHNIAYSYMYQYETTAVL